MSLWSWSGCQCPLKSGFIFHILSLFRSGTADGCLQRCLKLTSQNLDPALPVRGRDRDPGHDPSPNPAPVLVLSHGQESADLGKCLQLWSQRV